MTLHYSKGTAFRISQLLKIHRLTLLTDTQPACVKMHCLDSLHNSDGGFWTDTHCLLFTPVHTLGCSSLEFLQSCSRKVNKPKVILENARYKQTMPQTPSSFHESKATQAERREWRGGEGGHADVVMRLNQLLIADETLLVFV